jgi:hypothetical protein
MHKMIPAFDTIEETPGETPDWECKSRMLALIGALPSSSGGEGVEA